MNLYEISMAWAFGILLFYVLKRDSSAIPYAILLTLFGIAGRHHGYLTGDFSKPLFVAIVTLSALLAFSLVLVFGRKGTLHGEILSGNLEKAAKLISENGIDVPDAFGRTPLYMACEKGYGEMVRLLIDRGANVNAQDREGSTPLRTAVFHNHDAIVELLLSANANPNLQHGDGSMPLHTAAEVGNLRVVEILLQHGADIDAKHDYGEPIYAAAEKNQTLVVSYLLEKGSNIFVYHQERETLLHALAYQGHHFLVAKLIEKGLDVNARNSAGRIPLHYAVEECKRHKNLRLIELLIGAGSDRNAFDHSGDTPVGLAKQTGDRELVGLLTANAEDKKDKKGTDKKGTDHSL